MQLNDYVRFAKKLFRKKILGLLSFCVCASGQIQLVHVTNCGPGAFPGTTCMIPATGSGNLIVIGWQIAGGANTSTTITSMTDNVGNVYAEAGSARAIDTGASTVVDIWYAKNSAPGATSVTINPSMSLPNAGAVIWEFSGADTSAPLDTTAILNSQAATASPMAAAVATRAANEVIVSIAEVQNTVTGVASGNSVTNDSSIMVNGWAHLISSSAGTYAAQWNQSPSGSYASSTAAFRAAGVVTSGLNACDLNGDGIVNSTDVKLAINMALGTTTCTASVEGADSCTVITIQRVVNASGGQTCVTYNGHGVTLNWTASGSANVTGYNVYRAASSTGPFTKMNNSLINGTTYADSAVQPGQTYYYVATAVNSSGQESGYSTSVLAAIPTP